MKFYENRFIVFLDILGFKELVKKTTQDESNFETISKVLNYISEVRNENYHGFLAQYDTIKKEVSVFSDSIVISYPGDTRGGLFFLLMDLVFICLQLNFNGIFVRGGVTFGSLYHKRNVCFGPAMIAAYEMEQKFAITPRIIVDTLAITNGLKSPGYANSFEEEADYIGGLLKQDEDDNWFYLDYLSQREELDFPEEYPYFLNEIKSSIIKNLIEAKDDTNIYSKYVWYAKYYNRTIENLYGNCIELRSELSIDEKLYKWKSKTNEG